ncbi:hypothetical protein C2G38_2184257 [Gigaspora rosea]|uniref:Uncharacterized protein n=1 Tax=Gigaspora rosea TaxID=44941 RepID=A0A397VB81_9GLOM|nr:hypothetical protein C2G38_2184257 [Gigaspora rosea]
MNNDGISTNKEQRDDTRYYKKISNMVKYVKKRKHYKRMKDLSSIPVGEEPRHDEKKRHNTDERKPKTLAKKEPRQDTSERKAKIQVKGKVTMLVKERVEQQQKKKSNH